MDEARSSSMLALSKHETRPYPRRLPGLRVAVPMVDASSSAADDGRGLRLHVDLPAGAAAGDLRGGREERHVGSFSLHRGGARLDRDASLTHRSEEHTSELQ